MLLNFIDHFSQTGYCSTAAQRHSVHQTFKTYDHFIAGESFLPVPSDWETLQEVRRQTAYLELQSEQTKSRTDWTKQNPQCMPRVFCVVWVQIFLMAEIHRRQSSHPSGYEFVPQTVAVSSCPISTKRSYCQAPRVTGDPIREDPRVLWRSADCDKADTERQCDHWDSGKLLVHVRQ